MLVGTVSKEGININNVVWFKLYDEDEEMYGRELGVKMLLIVTNAGPYDEQPHEISYEGDEAERVFTILQGVTKESGWMVNRS